MAQDFYEKRMLGLLEQLEKSSDTDEDVNFAANVESSEDTSVEQAATNSSMINRSGSARLFGNSFNSGDEVAERLNQNLNYLQQQGTEVRSSTAVSKNELKKLRNELSDFNGVYPRSVEVVKAPKSWSDKYDITPDVKENTMTDGLNTDSVVASNYNALFDEDNLRKLNLIKDSTGEDSLKIRKEISDYVEKRISELAESGELKSNAKTFPEKAARYLESVEDRDHTGHRERLRSSLLAAEGDWYKISEQNIVEMLLTSVIPRVDVVPIMKNLFARFGSLHGIIRANYNDLLEVKGMTVNAALVLSLILKTYVIAEIGKKVDDNTYSNPNVFRDFFAAYFANATVERVVCAYIDNSMRIIDISIVSDGISDSVSINFKRILSDVSRLNAAGVVLAHNHVYGDAQPSSADVQCTRSLSTYLQVIGARLFDHVIVSPNETFSFCSYNDCDNYRRNSYISRSVSALHDDNDDTKEKL